MVLTKRLGSRAQLAVPNAQDELTELRAAMGRERKADDAYVEAADFLRELGYDNQAEIARVLDIAMNPNSLFVSSKGSQRSGRTKPRRLSVADDMRPVAAFLVQQGLNHAGLRTVFSGHPPVLGYSVDQRLRPLWEYLSTELALGDISATVAARPSLLGMRPDDMRKVVGWLQTQEYSADDIAKYLATTI